MKSRLVANLLRRPAMPLMALLLCLIVPDLAAAQEPDRALTVASGERVAGDVATLAQDIVVHGAVDGDVTSWSGNITIAGHVGGDVVSYAGRITLEPSGQVDGHVLALGGGFVRDTRAQVAGQTLGGQGDGGALASLFDLFAPRPAAAGSAVEAAGRAVFGVVLGFFLLAFCLLWGALLPRRTTAARLTLGLLPGRSLLLGLLSSALLLVILPPIAALLAASLVGLPVLALLLVAVHTLYICGLTVLAHEGGALLARRAASRQATYRAAVAVLASLAVFVGLVAALWPLAGLSAFYLLAAPGLGAAILSRGGLALPRLA